MIDIPYNFIYLEIFIWIKILACAPFATSSHGWKINCFSYTCVDDYIEPMVTFTVWVKIFIPLRNICKGSWDWQNICSAKIFTYRLLIIVILLSYQARIEDIDHHYTFNNYKVFFSDLLQRILLLLSLLLEPIGRHRQLLVLGESELMSLQCQCLVSIDHQTVQPTTHQEFEWGCSQRKRRRESNLNEKVRSFYSSHHIGEWLL